MDVNGYGLFILRKKHPQGDWFLVRQENRTGVFILLSQMRAQHAALRTTVARHAMDEGFR